MSGQSAGLSLREAVAMQNRTQVPGTQGVGCSGGGSGNTRTESGGGRSFSNKASKKPHTEAKYESHKKEDKE
jgi:hypothetical protein